MSVVAIGMLIAFLTVIVLNMGGFLDFLLSSFLYNIAKPLMWLCDFVQVLFRRLAGLDTTYYKDANGVMQTQEDDILFSLLTSRTVQQTFLAMVLVGVCIIIIASVVQMIRVEYTTEGSKNNKSTILSSALKGISYFFIVPVAVTLGIMISNYILKAVDKATSYGGGNTIAGSVFIAAASGANRVRNDDHSSIVLGPIGAGNSTIVVNYDAASNTFNGPLGNFDKDLFGITGVSEQRNREMVAEKIDNMFASGSTLSALTGSKVVASPYGLQVAMNVVTAGVSGGSIATAAVPGFVSYDNQALVTRYYNMADIDFLMLYMGLCICIVSLFKAAFGMIMRIYQAIVLFIISPGIIGIWPLDNGKAFGSWRSKFIASVISAYGVVIAFNLYFVVAGALRNVYIFPNYFGFWTLNLTCQALFTIVGAIMVNNLAGTISSLIGADDGLKQGGEMAGKVASGIGKGVATVAMVAGGVGALAGKVSGMSLAKMGKSEALGKARDTITTFEGKQSRLAELKGKKRKSKADKADIQQLENEIQQGQGGYDAARKRVQDYQTSVARNKVLTGDSAAMFSTFARKTGMVKALNTMSADLLPIFGGKTGDEVKKAAAAKPGYSDDLAILTESMKNRPERPEKPNTDGMGKGEKAKAYGKWMASAAKHGIKEMFIEPSLRQSADRKKDEAKQRSLEIQGLAQTDDRRKFMAETSGVAKQAIDGIAQGILKAFQDIAKDGATAVNRQRLSQVLVSADNAGVSVSGIRKAVSGAKDDAELQKLATEWSADGKLKKDLTWKANTVYADALKVGTDSADNATLGKWELVARELKKAGHAIETMAEKASKAQQDYAVKEGKPEVAITAMASSIKQSNSELANTIKQSNDELKQLIKEMVNKSN